ncbi:putative peptide maturation dehydrogenase [Stenotrophomonas maltophilia]|uniref:putative peptide maturation dehydrogenase n=1 Tax=Stenotrophomonas maltophilia TaxID=40324 RepID=UPI000C263926|nr:putative peptide maturation dehydrogenase [Stenotrophomonas maltophilia]PJL65949.1 putative peptide maturation dehydrogenase [Stenotrophomonas maltophilia]
MRLRRCASLMFEPREAVTLDLRAMLAGHAEMDSQISWVALAAHLDQPLPVDAEERQLLGELSAHRWSEPPADASPAMLARLVEQGLLLTDPPSEVGHQLRDEALRRSQWWPLAALAHRHARWQAVDSVEDMRRQGLDTAAGLRQRLGPPPPVVQPMQGDYQPLPRSEEAAFDALLARRTTCRNFDPQRALPLPLLAQVLQRTLMAHAVQKVERDTEFLKKNVPSGGGLHPTEGFLLVQNVKGLAPGLYHYHPVQHAVLPLPSPPPDALPALARRMLSGQAWFADAPALLVLAPRYDRCFWKYRNHAKAHRAVTLDVGHISQLLYLCATERGLAAFVTAAINDADVDRAFGFDGIGQSAMAICGLGWRSAMLDTAEFDPAGRVATGDDR